MKSETTLKNLQTAQAMKLTAMRQYQLHGAILSDWELDRLAAKMGEPAYIAKHVSAPGED